MAVVAAIRSAEIIENVLTSLRWVRFIRGAETEHVIMPTISTVIQRISSQVRQFRRIERNLQGNGVSPYAAAESDSRKLRAIVSPLAFLNLS